MKRSTAFIVFLAVASLAVSAAGAQSDYTIIHHFAGPPGDGANGYGSLISDGSKLYGMTAAGGSHYGPYSSAGYGTIFSINPDGTSHSILHDFAGPPDGGWPHNSLISDGSRLYGTTFCGGFGAYCGPNYGCGTVFAIDTDGSDLTILHNFAASPFDTGQPNGNLLAAGGKLYGAAAVSGTHVCLFSNCGALFSINNDGTGYTFLHNFTGAPGDGALPLGSFFSDGARLYGTAAMGGSGPCDLGCGIIFSMNPDGTVFTIIHDFAGAPGDGESPGNSLISDSSKLYGMTYSGGTSDCGTIFSLDTDGGNFVILHSFGGPPLDGKGPNGDLLLAGNRIYGLTTGGGTAYLGVLFSMNRNGTGYTIHHSFGVSAEDGNTPYGNLIQLDGTIYGMTPHGGSNGWGAIFSLPLPPPPVLPVIDSGDYDGDGTSDIAIFRGSSGLWAVRGITRVYFGALTDVPAPGDYAGDGITGIGIFRPATGLWAIRDLTRVYFGDSSDMSVPGDYDGDGRCDVSVFRNATGRWGIRNLTRLYFGGSGDLPVPGCYDGDGTKDIAVFRPGSSLWAIRGISTFYFGAGSDIPVPGDVDGDGTWEAGVFRPATSLWAFRGATRCYFAGGTEEPVPADYDGDAADDVGAFRDSSGLWAVRGMTRVYYGTLGDIPVSR